MRQFLTLSLLFVLAAAAQAAEQFSREVGKPLQAAQVEMQKKRWDAALGKIKEAEAVKNKSAYEQYMINELKGFIYSSQGNYAAAAATYEENMASEQTPKAVLPARYKIMAQLYARLHNDKKTIEYGLKWIQAASEADAYELVAQTYYQQKDYRNAIKIMQDGIDAATRSGKKIEENWLILKLNSYYALKDDKGVLQTREQLVRSFPKPDYWANLLDTLPRQDLTDNARLDLYRLMLDLGVLKKPADYIEMGQMMMDKEVGVPAEAVTVIQKGIDNKVLVGADRARGERVLNAAKASSDALRKVLPQREQQADAAATGEADVQLGAIYSSYADYPKAIAALERGLKKGGLKDANKARMLLGIAYYRAGQREDARKAFKAVPANSPMARIADLWAIRVQQN